MRRRKVWGWGFEDEQPSEAELRAAAQGVAAHLGFGSPEPERPAQPRLEPPRVTVPRALPARRRCGPSSKPACDPPTAA